MLRVIVAVAAAAAGGGAVLLHRRDRAAEREFARVHAERLREERRMEERISDLESQAEELGQVRAALSRKLNAKRSELTRLRGEHADLLRRYAKAELERAAALESARLAQTPGTAVAPKLTPVAFLRANAALDALARGPRHPQPRALGSTPAGPLAVRPAGTQPRRAPALPAPGAVPQVAAARAELARTERPEPLEPARHRHDQPAAERASGHQPGGGADATEVRPVADRPSEPTSAPAHHLPAPVRPAAAVAVVPQAAPRPRTVPEPGFDYFGLGRPLAARAASPQGPAGSEDLADVIGDELTHEDPAVIDLTEHDETETIDVRELRAL
ncbi:hypothetical protein [Wenjunlia vitaminophila]|uniref:hypothetical protein n=1 Tax=Wenjunlia vitaminophila TaxID=76728 RepID=UPI00036D35DD|nr:hypothetical protein [Wenjunlia vitaminophila]